jgi:transcriptional regulator of NAD metabolism
MKVNLAKWLQQHGMPIIGFSATPLMKQKSVKNNYARKMNFFKPCERIARLTLSQGQEQTGMLAHHEFHSFGDRGEKDSQYYENLLDQLPSLLKDGCLKIHGEKQSIIYVSSQGDAEKLVRNLQKNKISCLILTSKSDDRNGIIERFRNKKIQILVCIKMLEQSFDSDAYNIFVLKRVKDYWKQKQILGRVLRKTLNSDKNANYFAFDDSIPEKARDEANKVEEFYFKWINISEPP